MTNTQEISHFGKDVFEHIMKDPKWVHIMISGREVDQVVIISIATKPIVRDLESQVVFLKSIIEALSQEGDVDVTNRRDAAFGMLQTPPIVEFLSVHGDAIFDTYLEALSSQKKIDDPYGGSVNTLLEAGAFIAPYFPQDDLSRTQLESMLKQVEGLASFPGERRHITSLVEDILENTTVLGARDARVKYWKLRNVKEDEIAEKRLKISKPLVEQSVARLIEDGELTSKFEASKERDEKVLNLT